MTVSPSFIQTGGVRAKPTPWGVPVRMTVPVAESHCAAEAFDEGGDVEDHVGGGMVLHDLAVEGGLDAQGVGVGDFVTGEDAGAEGAEAVEAFAAGPLAAAQVFFRVASRVRRTSLAQV